MEPKQVSTDLSGRPLVIETGKLARSAHGSATVSLGDTVVLATATMSENPREGIDFFPLMCEYEEKFYASGKIKGSRFIKREGRPSDQAIIRSRLIDRPLRPLFPKGMTNEVQIIATVLSCDLEVDPAATAITAASTALMLSGIPFAGPIAAVRIGFVDEKLILNPTYEQEKEGRLTLTVAGTLDAITMVEAGAKEISEETMLEALEMAHAEIKKLCQLQLDLKEQAGKPERAIVKAEKNPLAAELVASAISAEDLEAVRGEGKAALHEKIEALENKLLTAAAAKIEADEVSEKELKGALDDAFKKSMRARILEKGERIDARSTEQIRPLKSEVGILPRTHGTGLFQRGETQILSVATLGSPGKAQIVDTMDRDEHVYYFHHYNFPPYSVGEVRMLRGTGRREIGHGDLAERALLPVLPDRDDFAYTVRVVSETLTCNGSSSMGSVCGSTLALMDAGVPIRQPVSGIAMGLVTDKNDEGTFENYKVLSDIAAIEDFAGDMDFKVTGTPDGITALQMDIKVKGLSTEILREALAQAKAGRAEILQSMLAALAAPRAELSKYAPMIDSMKIHPDKIREVIGKGGETIQKICAECEVEIDIDDDGLVVITAPDQEKGKKAKDWVENIVRDPEVGMEYDGKVVKIMDFGAFVEIMPGKDGMVHISCLAPHRVEKVEDVVKVGEHIRVKLIEIDSMGRLNLTRVMPDGTVIERAPRR